MHTCLRSSLVVLQGNHYLQLLLLQVLENISAYSDGQVHIMKPSIINDFLELIVHGMALEQVGSPETDC